MTTGPAPGVDPPGPAEPGPADPGRAGTPPLGRRFPRTVGAGASEERLEASLRALELTVRHRLDGLLQGNHVGLLPGPGSEPGEARPYQPGDDVRRMDWAVTARTTAPHVRESIADRELETWAAVDLSASLDFGTADLDKRHLALAALTAVAHLTSGGGNRIGAVVTTGATTVRLPARSGLAHARGLVRRVATTPRAPDRSAGGRDTGTEGARGDLTGALDQLRRPPRRRGLVVVISDFLGEPVWERSLRALSGRHELLAIEIVDPRELELPDVGAVVLADPETGRQREVETTPLLRREFAAAASEHRDRVAATLRRCGCAQLTLRTDSDWVADIVRFAVARKHAQPMLGPHALGPASGGGR